MKTVKLPLLEKEALSSGGRLWRLKFRAPGIEAQPGQFVNIEVPGHYLRRPISVSDYDGETLSLVVQIVGEGTRKIVETPVGAELDMLTGLGNRFSLPQNVGNGTVYAIGGGVGYAPLIGLLKMIKGKTERQPVAVFGFNGREDVPEADIADLRENGIRVEVCTMKGDYGHAGNAVEIARKIMDEEDLKPGYFYTCGPLAMMKWVCARIDCEGELSLEARMGCGFGACMGCSIPTADGPRRICKDGPVFLKSKIEGYGL